MRLPFTHDLQDAIGKLAEVQCLSLSLRGWPRCDGKSGGCARLATQMTDKGLAPMCDACALDTTVAWSEIYGAARARRIEYLLTGEGVSTLENRKQP